MVKGYIIYHQANRTLTKGHADDTGINLKTTKAFNTTDRKDVTIYFDNEEAKRTAKLVKGSVIIPLEFNVPQDPDADPGQVELKV